MSDHIVSQVEALEQLSAALEKAKESGLLETMCNFGVEKPSIDDFCDAIQNMTEQKNWFVNLSVAIRHLTEWTNPL